MIKVKNEQQAIECAIHDKLSYGISVCDGRYYVGTIKQLDTAGVVMITTPYHPKEETQT